MKELDYITRKTSDGNYGYSDLSQRYYSTKSGQFVSKEEVRDFQEKSALINAIRFGQILSR